MIGKMNEFEGHRCHLHLWVTVVICPSSRCFTVDDVLSGDTNQNIGVVLQKVACVSTVDGTIVLAPTADWPQKISTSLSTLSSIFACFPSAAEASRSPPKSHLFSKPIRAQRRMTSVELHPPPTPHCLTHLPDNHINSKLQRPAFVRGDVVGIVGNSPQADGGASKCHRRTINNPPRMPTLVTCHVGARLLLGQLRKRKPSVTDRLGPLPNPKCIVVRMKAHSTQHVARFFVGRYNQKFNRTWLAIKRECICPRGVGCLGHALHYCQRHQYLHVVCNYEGILQYACCVYHLPKTSGGRSGYERLHNRLS
jgi:hypothetical protein